MTDVIKDPQPYYSTFDHDRPIYNSTCMSQQANADQEPQHFQTIIQIFYDSGSLKAKSLSTTNISWHKQCRNDLSAMKLPFPPANSLVCSVCDSEVQMAWNVHVEDQIVKQINLAFSSNHEAIHETQRKLDDLDIYQMRILKRWINPFGGENSTLAGVLLSSRASKDYYEASKWGTWASSSLLTPTFPLQSAPSKPSGKYKGASQQAIFRDLLAPPISTVSTTSSSLPPKPARPSSLPPKPPVFASHPSSVYTQRVATSTSSLNAVGPSPPTSVRPTPDPRDRYKRSISLISSPLPVAKRSKINDDEYFSSFVSRDDLERKCTELQVELTQEKNARADIEVQIHRLQQVLQQRGCNEGHSDSTPIVLSQLELMQTHQLVQGDAEECKVNYRKLEGEVITGKVKLEEDDVVVRRLRREVECEREQVEELRREVERLRARNASLIRGLDEAERTRQPVGSCSEEFEALMMLAEAQQRQLEDYKSRLQRAALTDEGRGTLGGQGRSNNSTSRIYAGESEREELYRALAQLDRERTLRVELEGIVEDMRRECRTPFIVPALVDALATVSRLTTKVKAIMEDDKGVKEVDLHLQLHGV
ncbi:hypothetical protein GYMLUDRAFT_78129 [Collybiopsis luxurians FD-317 M1]|uniref:Uncharacterized protein n=1 Tax=Collybiopsis luxurians FD-317 M1 TaxID=944289 RepID=A0A0D0C1J6_9AGAR|nr:hypothetical protein GYMLUDRAFT_78129 [Collybiopsis luxurians FD-317 M1]